MINLIENKKFVVNGKEHEITNVKFYPSKNIGQVGKVQGNLNIEIDGLFYMRMRVTTFRRKDGKVDTAVFGPSQEYDGKNYNQAGFTREANALLNRELVLLARHLYSIGDHEVQDQVGAFVDSAAEDIPENVLFNAM